MDIMSVFGLFLFAIILVLGVTLGEIPKIIFNLHSFLIVAGGTLTATLISSSKIYIHKSFASIKNIFFSSDEDEFKKIIPYIVQLAENSRKIGLKSLKEADERLGGGFVKRSCDAALEYGDYQFVKNILENEINHSYDEFIEVSNVYRTMGILSPMFGLIGTLLGIVGVLKELSNPEAVGPAMAVAITSAFYGILLSNLVFTPFANKIRARALINVKLKTMILEGVLEIMKGSIPLMVERRLKSFTD